jgi:hypothetical protein
VPMAPALGLRAIRGGRVRCRKAPCVTIRDRHSVSRAVLQRSSLLGGRPEPSEITIESCIASLRPWLCINLACMLIMRCVHRPTEEISFQGAANFDNDLAERRLSTLGRRSLQRENVLCTSGRWQQRPFS